MITALLLACIAILLNIAGRFLILREDTSLQGKARRAVALVPGAELIYLIIRWERARAGSAVCALAMALALPFLGQITVIAKHSGQFAASRKGLLATLETTIQKETLKSQQAQRKVDELEAIKAKELKVRNLQHHTMEWHELLRNREGYLCSEIPEEIVAFNQTAAAYHSLLAVSKVETFELEQLKNGIAPRTR